MPPVNDVSSERRWSRQYAVALGLVVAFGVLVVVMLMLVKGDEVLWQRRVYLFSAVQALVFTAVGWLFGREVNRTALESARQDAQQARGDAAGARSTADKVATEATKAQVAAADERAKGAAVVAAVESTTSSARQPGPSDAGGTTSGRADPQVDLKAFVQRLYGRSAD